MWDARQVNEHIHPIVDEMGDPKTFADWRLVTTHPAEMERLRIEPKRIEQLMMCEPEAGFLLRPGAALRYDTNTRPKPLAPEARQCIERPRDGRRLQKTI